MRAGQHMSPESRAKLSAARKGKPLSASHRAAIARGQVGKGKVSLFQRGDGRWCVMVRNGSYDLWYRVLMWNELGRELNPAEIVHHVNGDCSDDRLENLRITTQHDHTAHHYTRGENHRFTDEDRAKGVAVTRKRQTIACDHCGRSFELVPSQFKRSETHACSRLCANHLRRKRQAQTVEAEATGSTLRRAS